MKITFILVGLAVFGGAGWYFLSSSTTSQSPIEAAAKEQAAQMMASLYGTSTPPIQGSTAQAPVAAAANAVTIPTTSNQQKIMQATLHTNKGDITIEFSDATPNTVANFVKLARAGFYDSTKFHRVIKGFMIQGGDPQTKDDKLMDRWGTGGPGYTFADEIHAGNSNDVGTIAMANSGPNTNGSQFFINVAPNNFLDGKHTVFGKVTSGMDVVNAIQNVATGPNDRPVEPVIIESVTVA